MKAVLESVSNSEEFETKEEEEEAKGLGDGGAAFWSTLLIKTFELLKVFRSLTLPEL